MIEICAEEPPERASQRKKFSHIKVDFQEGKRKEYVERTACVQRYGNVKEPGMFGEE